MIILLFLGGIMLILGEFVMPKYLRMMKDFHVELPWVVMWDGRTMSETASVVSPLLGLVVALVCSQMFIDVFHPRYRGSLPYAGSSIP